MISALATRPSTMPSAMARCQALGVGEVAESADEGAVKRETLDDGDDVEGLDDSDAAEYEALGDGALPQSLGDGEATESDEGVAVAVASDAAVSAGHSVLQL